MRSSDRGYRPNGLNQYDGVTDRDAQQNGVDTAYNLNGNLKSDGSTTFTYDAENQLVKAEGAKTATLSYDPLGRLWQVTGSGSTTRFFYDGDRLISETDGAGNLLRAYAHGAGSDTPLVWWELTPGAGPVRRFLHADHQGSIVAVSDAATGTMMAINAYDPWGIPNQTNLATAGRFGYTGQVWLPEIGLWYYKARVYSPTLGRFLQTDPVGYKDQLNLYAYVGNDPVDGRDPTGEEADNCEAACKQRASAIMGETSGLRPQVVKGKDGKPEEDAKSAAELRKGRAAIGIISERGQKLHSQDASRASNPLTRRVWKDSVTAARNPDNVQLPRNATQFFVRNEDDPAEKAKVRNLGDPAREKLITSYGPFRSVGGGDAGKGNHIFIDIYAPER